MGYGCTGRFRVSEESNEKSGIDCEEMIDDTRWMGRSVNDRVRPSCIFELCQTDSQSVTAGDSTATAVGVFKTSLQCVGTYLPINLYPRRNTIGAHGLEIGPKSLYIQGHNNIYFTT